MFLVWTRVQIVTRDVMLSAPLAVGRAGSPKHDGGRQRFAGVAVCCQFCTTTPVTYVTSTPVDVTQPRRLEAEVLRQTLSELVAGAYGHQMHRAKSSSIQRYGGLQRSRGRCTLTTTNARLLPSLLLR